MAFSKSAVRMSHAERSQATQRRLIDTTIQVIQDKGFEAATIYEVAKAAGMTPGAVQHHFESKAALMMRVLGELIEADDRAGALWPQADWPLKKRAEHFVRSAWNLIYAQPRFIAAWSMYLGSRTEPEVVAHITQQRKILMARMQAGFFPAFPELADAGDKEGFMSMVFSTLRGLGLVQMFNPSEEGTEAQLACLVDTIFRRCSESAAKVGKSGRTRRPA